MSIPLFDPGETARIGPQAYDRRMIGRKCSIEAVLLPIAGEHRYAVLTESGMGTIVLEATLQKVSQRAD